MKEVVIYLQNGKYHKGFQALNIVGNAVAEQVASYEACNLDAAVGNKVYLDELPAGVAGSALCKRCYRTGLQ